MRVAACQPQDILNDVPRVLSEIERWTAHAERGGARLVLFPECFLQGHDVRSEHVMASAIELEFAEAAALA